MKRNFFTAALEAEAAGTVGPEELIPVQQDLQPEPGVGEVKGGEPSLDDIEIEKSFGEEFPFSEADAIDTVAESQEHTLALEHLSATVQRFCRMGAALEEIAETIESNVEAGTPVEPTTAELLTTAVDAAGIGEPLAEQVALESFAFSPMVATESFLEAVKDRAAKVWKAVAKFFKAIWQVTAEKLKRLGDWFRELHKAYDKIEKEIGVLDGAGGKPFQTAKFEKALHDHFFAPASTKSPLAAVENAATEWDQVLNIADSKLQAAVRDMNNAWSSDKPESVVASMNKVLAVAKQLTEMGASKFKHSSCSVEVNLPDRVALQGTGALSGTKVVFEDGLRDFSAGVKIATAAEVKRLKDHALRAQRAFDTTWNEFWFAEFEPKWKSRFHSEEDNDAVTRQLLVKYSNLLRIVADLTAGCVWGAAHGYYVNSFASLRWARFSIAEAKKLKRAAK